MTTLSNKKQNVLIVLANPEANSFSHRIAQTYYIEAEKAGKQVEILDLYAPEYRQDFLTFDENGRPVVTETTLLMQKKVQWADELVFVFPIWWFDMPAILKNWLDHTMAGGFAYKYKPKSLQPFKLLKGKTARVFCCSGAPKRVMVFGLLGTWLNWKFGRMGFVGIKLKSFSIFGSRPRKQPESKQAQYLEKVAQLAKK